jgi:hypothetical protein
MRMNKEEFEKEWKELINSYGNVWIYNKSGSIQIKANRYEVYLGLQKVFLFRNRDLIGVVKLKSIYWLG